MTIDLLALVDQKLEEVLARPGMWGGTDTLEPLVLLLSMLRARAANPTTTDEAVLKAYHAFLAGRVDRGAGDLRSRLGADCSTDTMVAVLREYVDLIRERGVAPRPGLTSPAAPET